MLNEVTAVTSGTGHTERLITSECVLPVRVQVPPVAMGPV